jgi:metal-dependent hydrolase (beta-lactamase superfamily II)
LAVRTGNESRVQSAHCTGWKAVHRLAAKFPDAFVLSTVGTTVTL